MCVLIRVIFYTLLERKILRYRQNRVGPNKIGILGLLQPLLDGFKLILNEKPYNIKFNKFIFLLGPFIILLVIIYLWMSLPLFYSHFSLKFSLLFLIVFLGLSIYGNLLRGWSSNSKFSFIGAIRGIAQTISYELTLIFSLLPWFYLIFSLNFLCFFFIKRKILLLLFPSCLIWLINILAECGRAPFDFIEGERELVRGFNTEFSRSRFALLFVGEYGIIIFFSFITVYIFFNKNILFIIFRFIILTFYLFMRTSYPRFRYDYLIELAWIKILPLRIFFLFFIYFLRI